MRTLTVVTPQGCDCPKYDYAHPHHRVAYTFHWSFGNGKLAKDGTISFGLPAWRSAEGFRTCPQASACAAVCYARQYRYRMPRVARPREHNLAWLRSHSDAAFTEAAVADLRAMHRAWQRVRIHDSGDFFRASYLDAWIAVAAQLPALQFYGYTKMIRLLQRQRLQGRIPPNLRLVQSVGGKEDAWIDRTEPHSIIFRDHASLHDAGYVDATASDAPVYGGAIRIGLVYHGERHLTPARARRLQRA